MLAESDVQGLKKNDEIVDCDGRRWCVLEHRTGLRILKVKEVGDGNTVRELRYMCFEGTVTFYHASESFTPFNVGGARIES